METRRDLPDIEALEDARLLNRAGVTGERISTGAESDEEYGCCRRASGSGCRSL
jgi:hypothetical protein